MTSQQDPSMKPNRNRWHGIQRDYSEIDAERRATLAWLGDRPEIRLRFMESVERWAGESGFELPDHAAV